MADKKEYVEVEGIKCEVKDPKKRAAVKFYQESLRPEIDKYIGTHTMTESRKAYANALEVNIKIAPFVLGWLRKPEDEDEYRVIKGIMTLEELESKRKKEARANKSTKKPAAKKQESKGLTKGPEKGQEKTSAATKKTVTASKSNDNNGAIKGPEKGSATAQEKDSTTKKAAPKTASKNTRKKS